MPTPTSTRAAILRAADRLFGEVGFDAATTRGIAQGCGVNKALIHYHFDSKHELFAAVLDAYYARLDAELGQALETAGPVRERLLCLLDTYVDFLAENRGFARMVQREAAGGRHLERIVAHTLPIFQRGVELLAEEYPVTRSGELGGAQLLVSFYGMVVAWFTYSPVLEPLLGERPLSPHNLELRKRHLRRMVDLVAESLRAESRQDEKGTSE